MAQYPNLPAQPTTPGSSDYDVPDGWYYNPTAGIYQRVQGGLTVESSTSEPYTIPGGTPTGGPPVGAPTGEPTTEQWAILKKFLTDAKLQELIPWAIELLGKGAVSVPQVETLLWEQEPFKKRFRVVFERQRLGLPPISPDEVLELERQYTASLQFWKMPTGMYDQPEDFVDWIVADKSPKEISDLLGINFTLAQEWAAHSGIASTLGQLRALYDWTPGNTLAMFLDPDRAAPLIQQQIAVAQIGRAAARTEFGQLSRMEAERLQAEGVTEEQARAGFEFLGEAEELLAPLPGQEVAEETFGRQTQLEVVGGNAQERRRLRRQQERRKAQFAGGGGFAAGREGLVGLGSSA